MTTSHDHALAMTNTALYRERLITTSDRLEGLGNNLATLVSYGLTPPPKAVALYERSLSVAGAVVSPARAEAERDDLLRRLVAGTITPEDAADRASSIEQRANRDGFAATMLRSAHTEVLSSAMRAFIAAGDTLITDQLRPKVEAVVKEAVDLLMTIGLEIRDDTSAMRGTPEQREAWVTLRGVVQQWLALHDFADGLRSSGIVPTNGDQGGTFFPLAYRYKKPDALRHNTYRHTEYWQLILIDAIISGAEPTILTDTEMQALRGPVVPVPATNPFEHSVGGSRRTETDTDTGIPSNDYSRQVAAAAG